jgi:class 3 adenylate cyclase
VAFFRHPVPMPAQAKLRQGFAELLDSDEARWNAVLHRDARLDGLLYYGVSSTGIFCRPVCPARRPKIENVAFFRSCDEAEKAGYRACKRCRPTRSARPVERSNLSIRPVAVLFIDIKGYSRVAARSRPDETFAFLDDFHVRTGAIVKAHDGLVHKHLGDGFMALFGARDLKSSDARRGIACGLGLLEAVGRWNDERQTVGQPAVAIGIGVHYGMTAFGPAGGEQAVIGDTVNVASRLERLTRRLDVSLAVSDDALRAVSPRDGKKLRAELHPAGIVRLPGCGPRRVWTA